MKKSFKKAGRNLWNVFPLIVGTILLVSLISILVPTSFYTEIFNKSYFLDSLLGSLIGSFSIGSPVISYILGGEMLNNGVSLLAVTAFLVSWVTVGIIQLPAESVMFGKKFAILRNITAFLFSIIVAALTVIILGAI